MSKIVIAKNTTASGISLGDLSGATIPASGTRNLSEQFEFTRIANALDLVDYVTSSGIVINDGDGDLVSSEALRYISYDDATSVQNIPIADPGVTNLQDGFAIRYDEGQFQFDFDTFSVLELANFYEEDDSYYITNASGTKIRLSQNFIDLADTPTTYSGNEGTFLITTVSGLQFADPLSGVDYFRFIEDDETSYTTSTSYVNKLILTVSGVPSGIYRLSWYFEYNFSTSNFSMYSKVHEEHGYVFAEVAHRVLNASDWFASSGFGYVSIDEVYGTHALYLDYRSNKANTAAGIRKSRLELRRIERDEY